ncbi:hypothetical protein PENSPDRAFT_659495 [Peniophora sp. CONT]|nr:hypothetical protein PENSPDRAFT_659495 [Peniophora sp. CONT]
MTEEAPDFTLIVPDETLCTIFSFVQLNEPIPHQPPDSRWSRREIDYGWVRITFVNRRWRQVAIDDAILWTRLTSKLGARWLRKFVQRSKSASFSVNDHEFLDDQSRTSSAMARRQRQQLLGILTAHRARTSSLRLHNPVPEVYEGAFASMLSTLEDCHIYSKLSMMEYPNHFPVAKVPHLRRLHIRVQTLPFAALNWTCATWSSMTSLNLVLDARKGGFWMPGLLDALRRMQSLCELGIRECEIETAPLRCDHRCSGASTDLIDLSSVKSVILESTLQTHVHFLRHIRLPLHARLALYSSYASALTEAPIYNALASALDVLFVPRANLPAFKAAYMTFADMTRGSTLKSVVTLGLTRQSCRPSAGPRLTGILFYCENPHEQSINDFSLHYHDVRASTILPSLSFGSVQTLTLDNARISQARAQCQFFPNVEHLRICVNTSPPRYNIGFLEEQNLLPVLSIVDMDGNYFNLNTVLRINLPAFEAVLKRRQEMGSPLVIFFHVGEEVALVRNGSIEETSCRGKGLREDVVREFMERLEAVEEIKFVGKDFDPFDM